MNQSILSELGFKLIGFAGVDSGLLCIVDPCYAMTDDRNPSDRQANYMELVDSLPSTSASQEFIFSKPGGNGVVFSTQSGDGNYPVYARFVDGRPAQVLVDTEVLEDE